MVHESMGAGGTGVGYRTTDRLSGQLVAFKHVTTPPAQLVFASRSEKTDAALATDREAGINQVARGVFAAATGGLVQPGMPGHSAGIAPPYDPEYARRLLAEAGYAGGRGFPATVGLCVDSADCPDPDSS